MAGVGLSEAEANAAGHEVKTSVITLDNVARAAAARDTRGVIKLVADAETDRLLGGQIAALTFVALIPGFLGLFISLPLLGHATWHLYRQICKAGGTC